MRPHISKQRRFRVQVGHATVVVEGGNEQDAVRMARMQLSREHPRLFDVIHKIEERKFRVDPAR